MYSTKLAGTLAVVKKICLSLILFPVVTNAQSVAEAAKQQRARLCKEGKTQYCDDAPQKDKAKRIVDDSWMEQGLSYQAAQDNSRPTKADTTDSVENLQTVVDEISNKTPRQLADNFVGEVQFPGRDQWEQRLDAARTRFVSATQVLIDLLRSDKATSGAKNSALYDMRLASQHYVDVQAEGQTAAADWKRKTDK